MENKSNTLINLPVGDVIIPTDEKACDKIFRKLMKKYLLESVNDYFSTTYIDYKLSRIIKIEMDKNTHYVGDTIYENRILKLPECFFTTEINKTEDVTRLISIYPELKDLLTTYAIYIVGYNYNNHDTEQDKVIKNIIATSLAVNNKENKQTELTKADMTFKSYATSHALLENVIREISLIVGKDKIYETLQYGAEVLIKEIDEKTRQKGLGQKIINMFMKLYMSSTNTTKYLDVCSIMQSLGDNKLIPMYKLIEKYNIKDQNTILNLIEMKNFDFSILKLIDENIDITRISMLEESEKEILKNALNTFEKNWESYRYLTVEYPETKPIKRNDNYGEIEIVFEGKEFSFLNKFFSTYEQCEYEYYKTTRGLRNLWEEIQELIILELIPRYIKNNKDTNINLEEILKLSRYKTEEKDYDISSKENKKIKRIKEKLNN